jgi:shikimate kinase
VPNIVLVGMMGAGKSVVAEVLAGKLGRRAVDTDHLVEERTGMGVTDLFAVRGEEAFREVESAAIGTLLGVEGPLVVSVGGGAVTRDANREVLQRLGTVVWLRAEPATLAGRVGGGEGRPLLSAGGVEHARERLVELARQRRPFYEQVADLVVDTDTLSPEEVAGEIVRRLAL